MTSPADGTHISYHDNMKPASNSLIICTCTPTHPNIFPKKDVAEDTLESASFIIAKAFSSAADVGLEGLTFEVGVAALEVG